MICVECSKLISATGVSDFETAIRNEALRAGINADIAVAISRLETGHWTSDLFLENNNFGGMINPDGDGWQKFESIEDGLDAYIDMLVDVYFSKGLDTLESIQTRYCPNSDEKWLDKVQEVMYECK